MNKPLLIILAAIVTAIVIAAPVIATNREAKAAAAKCGMFKKFDSRTKTCQRR